MVGSSAQATCKGGHFSAGNYLPPTARECLPDYSGGFHITGGRYSSPGDIVSGETLGGLLSPASAAGSRPYRTVRPRRAARVRSLPLGHRVHFGESLRSALSLDCVPARRPGDVCPQGVYGVQGAIPGEVRSGDFIEGRPVPVEQPRVPRRLTDDPAEVACNG